VIEPVFSKHEGRKIDTNLKHIAPNIYSLGLLAMVVRLTHAACRFDVDWL